MMTFGIGALAAAIPAPQADADPSPRVPAPAAPAPGSQTGREGGFGGLISGNWRGGIGTTWEARIKLNCLTGGAWPAWWLSNDFPGPAEMLVDWVRVF